MVQPAASASSALKGSAWNLDTTGSRLQKGDQIFQPSRCRKLALAVFDSDLERATAVAGQLNATHNVRVIDVKQLENAVGILFGATFDPKFKTHRVELQKEFVVATTFEQNQNGYVVVGLDADNGVPLLAAAQHEGDVRVIVGLGAIDRKVSDVFAAANLGPVNLISNDGEVSYIMPRVTKLVDAALSEAVPVEGKSSFVNSLSKILAFVINLLAVGCLYFISAAIDGRMTIARKV